jgi:hypothetical protein
LWGVDEAPGKSPPAEEQREQGEGQAFDGGVLAGAKELDRRVAAEGDNEERDAVLVDDETAAALDFEFKFLWGHAGESGRAH